jgi:hypothetical protein
VAIDRVSLAALLETRALDLPMVAAVKVRVGRRRATARIHGSADLVHARAVLTAELVRAGLFRLPRLRVRGRTAYHRPPMH